MTVEEINAFVEKNYNKKFDKTTSFIDDSIISNVLIKDKTNYVDAKVIRYIIGEYLDIKEAYRLRNADLIGNALDAESFDKALEDIYNIWNCDNKTKGILYPYCIFGNSIQLERVYNKAKDVASNRAKLACFMLEALALSANKKALAFV